MENKKVKTKIDGIGEIELYILQTGETWWCKEIEDFATHSNIRFSAILISKPELQSRNSFQSVLQKFISFIQSGGEPQSSSRICNHFNNWLNKQNGTFTNYGRFASEGKGLSGTGVIESDRHFNPKL